MVIQQATGPSMSKDVLYIGSAVPLETSEGLEAVQQPLRSRYPIDNDDNIQGILSTLSILPEGIELRYHNDPNHVILFPFSSLTMCAAVRCVHTINAASKEVTARFVSLSSPEAGGANSERPAIFTAITRRTKGRQVLECHGFIPKNAKDALDLVQWTSSMDKRSKQGGSAGLTTGHLATSYDISKGDTSFRGETSSHTDFPIHLVSGEPMTPNTAPAFYKEVPANGYFYSTKNAQVKKYSLHKFGGSTGVDDTPSVIPPGADHFERRSGYAASHYSATAAPPPGPYPAPGPYAASVPYAAPPLYPAQPPTFMLPVRPYRAATTPQVYIRPVIVGPPPPPPRPLLAYPRPRFFSPPPPPVLRARPVPILVSPPPGLHREDGHPRPSRKGSRGGSSSRSSSPSSKEGHARAKSQEQRARDGSSGSSSRPRTPPTDYDVPRGPRVSRREQFLLREQNGSPRPYRTYYMMPPPGGYYTVGGPGSPRLRPRSVPPYGEVSRSTRKEKKSKKNKKGRKKRGGYRDVHDESTDSVGYMSELADNRQPRDFRRLENQFKHERAFSKSLAEETRHSVRGDRAYNAYILNNTTAAGNENEFPTMY